MAGLFTIGYSPFSVNGFIDTLLRYSINVVIDVRSLPYSSKYSCYNKENIDNTLKRNKIHYRNYSGEFGARQTDLQYFSDEKYLDFELFAESQQFKCGFDKLKKSIAQGYIIALMCAEKDPATCHRSIMVSRVFYNKGYGVCHILPDGQTEEQTDIETQLLDKYFPDWHQPTLFGEQNRDLLIASAYKKRNAEIGYRIKGGGDEAVHDWVH
ncbi:MAG: DUF488 domain-containing protein [Holophagales bacterium]|nr:DUF488 domain-containing protein [Holophagales bacterium]